MAQFDVYINTNRDTVEFFPYLLDVQNDLLSSLKTRVVVPLGVGIEPIRHLNPMFKIDEKMVVMSTADMAGIPLSSCGEKVLNLEEKRHEIIDALDFLVNGF
jgi:toxin CcdB